MEKVLDSGMFGINRLICLIFSFVLFSSEKEASDAIDTMSGATVGNKILLCKFSHGIPRHNSIPNDNLYIKPLLESTTEDDIFEIFKPYGHIIECKVMLDKNTGKTKQIGFVRFQTIEEAKNALLANNGRILKEGEPPMVVKYAESKYEKYNRRAKLHANQFAASKKEINSEKNDIFEDELPIKSNKTVPYVVIDQFGNPSFATQSKKNSKKKSYQNINSKNYPTQYLQNNFQNIIPPQLAFSQYPPSYPNYNQYYQHNPNSISYNNFFPNTPKFKKSLDGIVDFRKDGSPVAPAWADDPRSIFVSNLDVGCQESELRPFFEQFGNIQDIFIPKKNSTRNKLCAFIKFYLDDDAVKAVLQGNGKVLNGKSVLVSYEASKIISINKLSMNNNYLFGYQQFPNNYNTPSVNNQPTNQIYPN